MIGQFLDWLAYQYAQAQGRAGHGYDYFSRRDAIGRKMRPLCQIIGHDPQGKVQPVWSTSGPFVIPAGDPRTAEYTDGCIQSYCGIVYFMRECSRCKKRIPVDDQSAHNKIKRNAQTAAIMNGSRSDYGLPPVDWDD